MTEAEVKEDLWKRFLHWMRGQTCGLNEDGSYNYYKWDYERFVRRLPKYQDDEGWD